MLSAVLAIIALTSARSAASMMTSVPPTRATSVLRRDAFLMDMQRDAGVDAQKCVAQSDRLGHTELVPEEHLTIEIALLDDIEVDEREFADPAANQHRGDIAAEPTAADDADVRRRQTCPKRRIVVWLDGQWARGAVNHPGSAPRDRRKDRESVAVDQGGLIGGMRAVDEHDSGLVWQSKPRDDVRDRGPRREFEGRGSLPPRPSGW